MSLTDKRVVVTGATGALGGAVVMALLERGAICHLPMVEPAVPDGPDAPEPNDPLPPQPDGPDVPQPDPGGPETG